MPLDQMAKLYHCKTKTLYPYEHLGLDNYDNIIIVLNIEEFKSSLSNKIPTQEEKSITLIKTTVLKLVKIYH